MAAYSSPVVRVGVSAVAPSFGGAGYFSGAARAGVVSTGDLIHGGPGRVYGNVLESASGANWPLRRKVRLHREVDGLFLREVWSDAANGAFSIGDINPAYRYYVVAFDVKGDHLAVAADNLLPEVTV